MRDIRFGLRMLWKSKGFTAVALATLALGIGANTTIFSIVNSVLLRPLPYEKPERIVQVADQNPYGGPGQITSSVPKFEVLHAGARSFSALAAVGFGRFQLSGPATAPPAEASGARVSADFFRVLGARPAIGREFLDSESQPGANRVAILSEALWRNRFAADPGVIGQTISVDGAATTIIGVMPAGFDFPSETEIWIPRYFENAAITPVQIQRGASMLLFYGRLADGADARTALAEVDALSHQYDASHPGFGDTNRTMTIIPLRDALVGNVRSTLLVLLGAVAFVLLIASANVANLLLARAVSRQKEVAIRAALGASRGRLLVQFLTESVLLSVLGAALGLGVSLWSLRFVSAIGPNVLPRADEIRVDPYVLLFTAAA